MRVEEYVLQNMRLSRVYSKGFCVYTLPSWDFVCLPVDMVVQGPNLLLCFLYLRLSARFCSSSGAEAVILLCI
jgi:hypothetical protein